MDIGVENRAGDFMSIRKASIFVLAGALSSCEPQLVDDPIPLASFTDEVMNLYLPEYSAIRTSGGYKELNSIGVRGVIIYRVSASEFRAFERNCSFQPNDACATVNVHASGLYLTDPCCGSTFSMEMGQPTGGPAWRPLRQYRTQLNGSILTISDEVVN
jgi:nitrite reductase/ring-hydroxylating ferredoxin subunit